MESLRLLTVHTDGDTILAVLPQCQLAGQEYREALTQDYRQLSQSRFATIRLDLRMVEHVDGAFAGLLVGFARSLAERGGRLQVQASPNLAELFHVIKLDRLFEVDGVGRAVAAGRGEPPATAESPGRSG